MKENVCCQNFSLSKKIHSIGKKKNFSSGFFFGVRFPLVLLYGHPSTKMRWITFFSPWRKFSSYRSRRFILFWRMTRHVMWIFQIDIVPSRIPLPIRISVLRSNSLKGITFLNICNLHKTATIDLHTTTVHSYRFLSFFCLKLSSQSSRSSKPDN